MSIFSDDPYHETDILYIRRKKPDYDALLTLVRHGWGGRLIPVDAPYAHRKQQRFKTPLLMTRNEMYVGEKEIYGYINRKHHEHHRSKFAAKRRVKTKDSNP